VAQAETAHTRVGPRGGILVAEADDGGVGGRHGQRQGEQGQRQEEAKRPSPEDPVRRRRAPSTFPKSGAPRTLWGMCRNIRPLHNFAPPATQDEVRDAALQYVRKISGTTKPSKANAEAFDRAVDAITEATARLLDELVTVAPPKDREVEAAKRQARYKRRIAA
jgi:hypothetical protein